VTPLTHEWKIERASCVMDHLNTLLCLSSRKRFQFRQEFITA
jgi:hypothetical protein